LFYAEGNWDYHLDSFAELPDASIVFHVDRGDLFETHRKIGHKFCLSGGVPNTLLSYGTPDAVRACCKRIIDEVAADGGYIMDASAIMQDDTSVENMRALTDFTREYGIYSSSSGSLRPCDGRDFTGATPIKSVHHAPGTVTPWAEKKTELPAGIENEPLLERIWSQTDAQAYMFVYQCLLSF
jgi:hypothetical protein